MTMYRCSCVVALTWLWCENNKF